MPHSKRHYRHALSGFALCPVVTWPRRTATRSRGATSTSTMTTATNLGSGKLWLTEYNSPARASLATCTNCLGSASKAAKQPREKPTDELSTGWPWPLLGFLHILQPQGARIHRIGDLRLRRRRVRRTTERIVIGSAIWGRDLIPADILKRSLGASRTGSSVFPFAYLNGVQHQRGA